MGGADAENHRHCKNTFFSGRGNLAPTIVDKKILKLSENQGDAIMADKKILGRTESDATSPQICYGPTSETNVFYPESDGKPMAETERHRDLLINTLLTFQAYFQDIPDVCVSGNMMMYYVEGNPRKSISPDIFVTFGVGRKERRTYRIWEEGKPPDFVLEFSSGNTYRNGVSYVYKHETDS